MLIKSAWAAASETAANVTTSVTTGATDAMAAVPAGPGAGEAFAMNMGLITLLVVMFYFLLIRPQQKRFKEHADMLSKLNTGTKIVTQGGMVGTIHSEVSEHEVVVDLGNSIKVNVMRSAIMGRYEDALPKSAANDDKKSKRKA